MQSCISLEADSTRWLLDCGATTLLALQRSGVPPSSLDGVLITHLHGDHAGGLPALLLDLALHTIPGPRRERPLIVAGPPELARDLPALLSLARWQSSCERLEADGLLRTVDLRPRETASFGALSVEPFAADHTPEALSFRVTLAGLTIAYSGDTGWTEALPLLARDADLFICQVYSFDQPMSGMIDYRTLATRRAQLTCKRLILTHVGPNLHEHLAEVSEEVAYDGQTIEL